MRRSIRTAITSAIALAVVGGGAAVATAATAPIPANTIHGCVTGNNRVLEHVYTVSTNGTTCPKGSFMVTFPSRAADGVRGLTGPAGPPGPPGAPGASELTTQSSVIQVTDHDDSGVHGNWAKDTYAMDMTVIRHGQVDASNCGGAQPCYFYTGSILDAGTFTSVAGADSPSAGTPLPGTITGSFNGGSSFQFYADSGDLQPSTLTAVDGGPGSSDPSWPASFLPGSAHVSGYSLGNSWGWTYNAPGTCETWVNAAAGNSGDITGVNACTS